MWKKAFFVYTFTGLVLLGIILWHLVVGPADSHEGAFYNKGKNAVWLQHSWIDTEYSWETISQLLNSLEKYGITYAYLHSGPVEKNGKVPEYRYVYAKQFMSRAKAVNPNIKIYAWLGQKREKIDLNDAVVRLEIVKMAKFFMDDVGFDGVHYDFEAINGYDQGFIDLVEETAAAVGKENVSVALEEYIPDYILWGLSFFDEVKDSVSEDLVMRISDDVDQFVFMSYDTGVDDPEWYRWLVKQEIVAVTRLLPDHRVLVGIPSYDEGFSNFNAEAENIESALKGVIDGLNNRRSVREAFEGVAVYSYWETDSEEWRTYDLLWQGK